MTDSSPQHDMTKQEATSFLNELLGKQLRVQVADGRMFRGQMKCTDRERNIILANTHEYRVPTKNMIKFEVDKAADKREVLDDRQAFVAAINSTARFVGLVVMPGKDVRRVEIEEFDAQAAGFI